MNCPNCRSELEIFARGGKEIYVCPLCLSALLLDESAVKILKQFCSQEVLSRFLSDILDDSLFDNTKKMLAYDENLVCPKCKFHMQQYDFNKKLKFYVNRCTSCGAIWLNPMQMPLVSIAFIGDSPDDLSFKKSITTLYEMLAQRKARKIRPIDEIVAPYAVLTGLLPSIPRGDNILTKGKPLATRGIIIACISVFVLQIAAKEVLPSFSLIADKVSHGEWYRLITYTFLHGGIFHLLGNMYFLYIFSRSLENELGWKKFLSLFTLGAVVSGIFFMATTAKKDIPCVGASGAISAVIGAYLIMFPKAKLTFDLYRPIMVSIPIPLQKICTTQVSGMAYILLWIIMNLFFGMLQSGGMTVAIAYWGHIGGFIAGVIFIEVYKNLKRE